MIIQKFQRCFTRNFMMIFALLLFVNLTPAVGQLPPGTIEIGRSETAGKISIYVVKIDDLTWDQIQNLKPETIRSLGDADRDKLTQRTQLVQKAKDDLAAMQKRVDDNFYGSGERKIVRPVPISKEQYESARKELERLEIVKKKLGDKIKEVEKWKNDQEGYSKEFDDMRTKAIQGSISDILNAVPIEDIVKTMSVLKKYKDYSLKLETAYKTIKATNNMHSAMASSADALFEKDDLVASRKMIEGDFNAQKALLAISTLPEKDKKWLTVIAKLYENRAKVMLWNNEQKENPVPQASYFLTHSAELKEGLDLVGVFFPPARIGLAIENLSERAVTLIYTKESVDAINNAFNLGVKADFILKEKIESINSKIVEQKRLITLYNQ